MPVQVAEAVVKELMLNWRCTPGVDGYPDYWCAIVGPLDLSVRVPLREANDHCWFVKREPNEGHPLRGTADSLEAAQLAAESAALQWLSEGVTALGGRVLDTGDVEALRAELDGYDAALARKLGGEHG